MKKPTRNNIVEYIYVPMKGDNMLAREMELATERMLKSYEEGNIYAVNDFIKSTFYSNEPEVSKESSKENEAKLLQTQKDSFIMGIKDGMNDSSLWNKVEKPIIDWVNNNFTSSKVAEKLCADENTITNILNIVTDYMIGDFSKLLDESLASNKDEEFKKVIDSISKVINTNMSDEKIVDKIYELTNAGNKSTEFEEKMAKSLFAKYLPILKEKFTKDDSLEKEKSKIVETIKEKMIKEDFEESEKKINEWINTNVTSVGIAKEIIKDPSSLIEELGLYMTNEITKYLKELFKEDSDVMDGLSRTVKKGITENLSNEDLIHQIYPTIEKDMKSKDLDVPVNITKRVLSQYLEVMRNEIAGIIPVEKEKKEEKKEETKILDEIVKEKKEVEANKEKAIDVDFKEEETIVKDNIDFDDSNLVEVTKLLLDNEDGLLVSVKGGTEVTINHADLIETNGKMYITHACYQSVCDVQKFYNEKTEGIKNNPYFQKLINGIDPKLKIRVDLFPGATDFDLDIVRVTNADGSYFDIQIDLNGGKYITKHSKILLTAFNKLYTLEIYDGLLKDIIEQKYSQEELDKLNIITEGVLKVAEHLDLTRIPTKSFNALLDNIMKNKTLSREVTSGNNYYCFEGNITSKEFKIHNIDKSIIYTYKNGKLFKGNIK